MPAMRPNCRSSGVATADAIVSGLAPGNPADTCMTGNSTCGSGATGRKLNARMPEISSAIASREVPIGRLMNGAEIFIANLPTQAPQSDCRYADAKIAAPTDQTTGTPQAWYRASATG